MMKFYKLMFINSLIFSTLITLSSFSWFFMWLGMEMNLLSFVPLMYNSKCNYSSESTMKYFIVQALASTLLLFSIIMLEMNQDLSLKLNFNPSLMILYSALMLKLGLAPFHFWFPEVAEGLNWNSLLILFTWQKLAPMSVLMMTLKTNMMFLFIVIISSMISGLMGINQISTRKILAYSSINHMSWMLMSMFWSMKIWLLYFLIYSVSNFFIMKILKKLNVKKINQMNSLNLSIFMKICFLLNFMSLSGLPPLIGFLPKWLTISINSMMGMEVITVILITSTLLSIFFYMRLIMPMIFLKTSVSNTNIMNLKSNFLINSFNVIFMISLPISNIFI